VLPTKNPEEPKVIDHRFATDEHRRSHTCGWLEGINVDLTLGQGYSRLLLIEIVSLESIEDLEIIGTLEDIDILK